MTLKSEQLKSAKSGILKHMGDRLRADPQARCTTSQKCIDMVKSGQTVYTGVKLSFKNKNLYIWVMLCACFVGKTSRVEMGLYWQQWKMILWLRENATWKCLKVSTWSCKYLGPCRRKVLILTQLTLGMCRFFCFNKNILIWLIPY